jgi:N-acetylglutamate synthase-like GNAT family acetyltransferase
MHPQVATLHDLIVHPALQGYGLGSSLLARLVGQVSGGGVYDVGLVSPASLAPFFHSCSFDLDRESSEPMALLSSSALTSKDVHAINAPLQSSRSLLALLDSQLGTAGQPHERHAASQQLARHQ